MKISIKLQGSSLVGIDLYELTDDSLEGTLQAILGTYVPTLTTRGGSTVTPTETTTLTVTSEPEPEPERERVTMDRPLPTPFFQDLSQEQLNDLEEEYRSRNPITLDEYPNLSDMTWSNWVRYMEELGNRVDTEVVTTWLDHVFFPRGRGANRIFRQARTVHDLVTQNPQITRRISMPMWVELVGVLSHTGALPRVAVSTARTYYNTGRRLTN